MKLYPTLYPKLYKKRGDTDKILVWWIEDPVTVDTEDKAYYVTTNGQIDGKLKTSLSTVMRNQRFTAIEAKEIKIKQKYKLKKRAGYTEDPSGISDTPLPPMKYEKWEDRKDKITYPCMASWKLNGLNVTIDPRKEELRSRGMKEYRKLKSFRLLLQKYKDFDGVYGAELYCHGKSLDEIRVMMDQDDSELKLYLFTKMEEGMSASDRVLCCHRVILDCSPEWQERLALPQTKICQNKEEYLLFHEDALLNGAEGTVVQCQDAKYHHDKRVINVLKNVPRCKEEFEVVDYTYDLRDNVKCIKWVCKAPNGRLFSVVPKGSLADRYEKYVVIHSNKHVIFNIKRMVTVEFMNYTEDGLPFHPVAELLFRTDI